MIKDDSNDINQKENLKDEDIILVNNESIFNPFNPLNNEICKNDVIGILNNYGVNYRIDNIVLYQRAFTNLIQNVLI